MLYNQKILKNRVIINNIFKFFIFVGIALTTYQFFYNRGLWLDESFLALSIVKRNFIGLLKPLSYCQVAPIGFLYVSKLFALIFKNSDWSLRLFPFIGFLISVPLYLKLTFKLGKSKSLSLLACAIYVNSVYIIKYATEFKQYSTDVLCTIIILLATMTFMEKQSIKNGLIFSLAGTVAIWFSTISVIILFTVGLYCLYKNYKNIEKLKNIALIISSWLISFLIYFSFFIHNHPLKKNMINFWTKHNGLYNKKILSIDWLFFMILKIRDTLELLSLNKFFLLWVMASVCFFVIYPEINIRRKKKGLIFLTLFPILIHFLLSSFKIYPYYCRLILYFIPLLTFIYAYLVWEGVKFLNKKVINLKFMHLNILLLILPLLFALWQLHFRYPIQKEQGREAMKLINEKSSATHIYICSKGAVTPLFYKYYYPNTKNKKHIFFDHNKMYKFSQDLKSLITKTKEEVWVTGSLLKNKEINMIINKLKEEKFSLEVHRFHRAFSCCVTLKQ